ncbi:helix-turn-helix domain-containing protein [Shimazuella alba]|uniref:Tetratricopeptide repeat protein n=1 Tax=Shimazuella alba TaxID=2690964 RepID=A0A6I4VYW0_9BACL|nr:helix-turn-helix transcriptional regulator [Shimazuella alba]MXQ55135.1 tetratricopeptide repeat protein [Shimazuella alba]
MSIPSFNKEKMGEIFRETRKKLGLRQEDVANISGLSVSTVSNIELANHRVKEENLISYANVLGIQEDIFGLLTEEEKRVQRVKHELKKIELLVSADPDEALRKLYILNENEVLENKKNIKPYAYYLWGKCYLEKKKLSQADKFLNEAVSLIEEHIQEDHELKKSNLLAACLNDLARISFFQSNFKNALKLIETALQSFYNGGERLYFQYFLLLNRCVYLEKMNSDKLNKQEKLIESLEKLQKSISEFENIENMIQHVRLSVIIQYYEMYANVWNRIGMTEKAIEFAEKGINIAWLNLEFDRLLQLWNTMGNIFLNKGKIQESKEYFQQALDVQSKIKREYLLIPTFMNLGRLYLQTSDPLLANKYLEEALQISIKNDDIIGQMDALKAIGNTYLAQDSYTKAISYFEKSYHLAVRYKLIYRKLEVIDDICTCYKKIGKREEFLTYTEKSYLIRQKIKTMEEGGIINED